MDHAIAARSMEPLGRPIDSKAEDYPAVEHLLRRRFCRFGRERGAAEHHLLPHGRSDRMLAVSPTGAGHDQRSARRAMAADLGRG
jgi:hypothetical protein